MGPWHIAQKTRVINGIKLLKLVLFYVMWYNFNCRYSIKDAQRNLRKINLRKYEEV